MAFVLLVVLLAAAVAVAEISTDTDEADDTVVTVCHSDHGVAVDDTAPRAVEGQGQVVPMVITCFRVTRVGTTDHRASEMWHCMCNQRAGQTYCDINIWAVGGGPIHRYLMS